MIYDVIVVGGGHAGCEAANIAAKMNKKVLLVTMNMETIAKMSCNPAMGGVAKGQIIREIDALGGLSAEVSDLSTIQFRMLNRSKGAAMWSPRSQNDRHLFSTLWRKYLESNKNIDFVQDTVKELIIKNNSVAGVITYMDNKYYSNSVVLTNGTFLNGVIHIGDKNYGGGRMGENNAKGITEQLIGLGFTSGRMKTGTPPRIDGRTLDYELMEEQKGDINPSKFSFNTQIKSSLTQKSCYITYTNNAVHDKLREGFNLSPMFNGAIEGLGPRYCPSIEDKINRFADRDRHQIFVEPEGINTIEMYVNGFSTSLPEQIQYEALKLIPGFANVKMFRPGYAIEYDYFEPTQLNNNLETKLIQNLFFAGQINGTTGYEEAAGQGLIAGINASLKLDNKQPLVLKRNEAYIGVLIDDLINKGTDEPYRMFTSRAEYRITLRQDNADERLSPIGIELNTLDENQKATFYKRQENIKEINKLITTTSIEPININEHLQKNDKQLLKQKNKLKTILIRPDISLEEILNYQIPEIEKINTFPKLDLETAEIFIKYESYIQRENDQVEKLNRLEHLIIPNDFDYRKLISLSNESRNKLQTIKPKTIGQAKRISGVSPADISILLVYFGR